MKQRDLKAIRVFFSLLFLVLISMLFIDFRGFIPSAISDVILYLQFVPSLLRFMHVLGFAAAGFVIIIIINLLFGRVYCSAICPLGSLQDIVSFIARKTGKKKMYRYAKPHNLLRYMFLALPVIFIFFGGIFLVYLLDPYSIFGRIFSDLLRPLAIGINNIISLLLKEVNVYSVPPYAYKHFSIATAIFSAGTLGFIIWISFSHGRLFCNSVCPVGTILGLIARVSVFKIRIDRVACTKCAKCAIVCKASCIDIKNTSVDFSRCIGCYNCIKSCPDDAINYSFSFGTKTVPAPEQTDKGKREFLVRSVVYLSGLVGLSRLVRSQPVNTGAKQLIPVMKENPVSPPGSKGLSHFNMNCTACHLCVTACPTSVLQPSFLEYGITGMMQPHMDYKTSFCNYECTICGEVCPTGAILPLGQEDKKLTQIGRVHFIMKNCVVYTDNTACGSCSEHCPTQAVRMVPYSVPGKPDLNLTIPEIHPSTCIGCGACEYACPVTPHKAIYVDGNEVHLRAEKPHFEKLETEQQEEFPF